jgi:hypothetical protein
MATSSFMQNLFQPPSTPVLQDSCPPKSTPRLEYGRTFPLLKLPNKLQIMVVECLSTNQLIPFVSCHAIMYYMFSPIPIRRPESMPEKVGRAILHEFVAAGPAYYPALYTLLGHWAPSSGPGEIIERWSENDLYGHFRYSKLSSRYNMQQLMYYSDVMRVYARGSWFTNNFYADSVLVNWKAPMRIYEHDEVTGYGCGWSAFDRALVRRIMTGDLTAATLLLAAGANPYDNFDIWEQTTCGTPIALTVDICSLSFLKLFRKQWKEKYTYSSHNNYHLLHVACWSAYNWIDVPVYDDIELIQFILSDAPEDILSEERKMVGSDMGAIQDHCLVNMGVRGASVRYEHGPNGFSYSGSPTTAIGLCYLLMQTAEWYENQQSKLHGTILDSESAINLALRMSMFLTFL